MYSAMAQHTDSVFSAIQEASRKVFIAGMLLAHLDAAPECHVVFDLLGGILRLRVKPCGIRIDLLADLHIVIAGQSFPRTSRMGHAASKAIFLNRVRRKIVVV